MKVFLISYKESLDDEVMARINSFGITSFTKWQQVQDQAETGYPRMGTHIWPGYNTVILFIAGDDTAGELMKDIRKYNEETKFESIKAMNWTLDEVC